MSDPKNRAVWLSAPRGEFIVGDADYPIVPPGHVVVKNGAVGINPLDWKVQLWGKDFPIITEYPFILGSDCAGTVHKVGRDVDRFKPGDRVIGMANWCLTKQKSDAAFQSFTLINADLLAQMPDDMSFVEGAVLPTAICSAAMGLYPPGRLELTPPSPVARQQKGEKMLIWGGGSLPGTASIQLSLSSGVAVVAVAAAQDHDFVMSLGVTAVFDYSDPRNLEHVIGILKSMPGEFRGALDCVGEESTTRACAGVVHYLGGGKVVSNSPFGTDNVQSDVKVVPVDDTAHIVDSKYVTEMLWHKFLPNALRQKLILPLPRPTVVGKGLEAIGASVARCRENTTARKLVVEL